MEFLTEGVIRIWAEEEEQQLHFLKTTHEEVRGMEDISSMIKTKSFFVPNATYLTHYFGQDILNPKYSLYDWEGHCMWIHFIIHPIWDLRNEVVGFVGYDIMSKAEKLVGVETDVTSFYRYPSAYFFNRGKYLHMLPGTFEKALKDKYLLIVDGVYDMYSLANNDLNVASALSSGVSQEVLFLLSFIENIFVLRDNDTAGLKLYDLIEKTRKNVFYIDQGVFKDSDDTINSEYKQKYISEIKQAIEQKSSSTIRLRTLGTGLNSAY